MTIHIKLQTILRTNRPTVAKNKVPRNGFVPLVLGKLSHRATVMSRSGKVIQGPGFLKICIHHIMVA